MPKKLVGPRRPGEGTRSIATRAAAGQARAAEPASADLPGRKVVCTREEAFLQPVDTLANRSPGPFLQAHPARMQMVPEHKDRQGAVVLKPQAMCRAARRRTTCNNMQLQKLHIRCDNTSPSRYQPRSYPTCCKGRNVSWIARPAAAIT